MAGDWIKMERATIDKPEVLEMADLLSMNPDEVFGKLFRVWRWFDEQSRDGHAGNVTSVTLMKFIDRLVSSQGFAAAMKKVGWLTDDGLPNFIRHNGESAKNRALAKDRKADERSRKSHAETVTREEKRREDINRGSNTTVSNNTSDAHPVDNFKPVFRESTSQPRAAAHSMAKTQRNKAELRKASELAAPMPEWAKKFVKAPQQ